MDVRTLSGPQAPTTEPWIRLAELIDRRAELAAHLDALDREQRAASEAAAAASAKVANLERRSLGGEPVTDAQRQKAERELTQARARQSEPWAERRAGAGRALADHDAEIQRFAAANYPALHDGLRELGREAANAVDRAANDLIDAHERWEGVLSRMIALASSVRPTRPGDWVRSRSERAAAEAGKVLVQGGELTPDVRDPYAPRSQPAEHAESVTGAGA